MIASSHITLSDLNDPIQQDTAPPSAAEGALWLDTSQSPPVLKRFDGDDWEAVQDEEWLERKLSSVYAQISTETDRYSGYFSERNSICSYCSIRMGF